MPAQAKLPSAVTLLDCLEKVRTATNLWRVSRSKPSFFWPLRLIAALTLVAPAAIFAYATWENYRAIDAQANERIERALDVLQEHALKAFQTVERSISEINEVLRSLSEDTIRGSESDLFLRFKRTQQALPQIESIWAFDAAGHPLVSSTILPVPRELNNSDRSYFAAQKNADVTYISEVVKARIGSLRFFVVSGRRHSEPAGRFNGVIGVTVMPEHFSEFYRKLTRGRDTFALVREDGTILARFPEVAYEQLSPSSEFVRNVQGQESGVFTATSQLDAVERRFGYRRVPGLPVYVTTAIETGALRAELLSMVATQLAIGLPVVLAMFALTLYALRGAQRFQEETARREIAETALKQAQRLEAVGRLTGGVAHDFNNLLMVVHGNVERLKRYISNEDRPRKAVAAIETAVRRGADLTRQLLSFSRRQTHEAITVDLKERLPVIQQMLQSSLRGDISVVVRVADGLWHTKVDISEFELALLNLAVNARDAMSEGGRLILSAGNITLSKADPLDLEGEFVAVSVQDSGTGIPSEILNRVFEPFFTTKDVGKGTGLGLSQVYGFAQQAGGTATIASEPGKGTTVTLYLPRSKETADADASAGRDTAQLRMREGGTVLLVEDNSDVADVTRGLLEQLGYTVFSAEDVESALAVLRARNRRIDVVLTDIVMPGGANGLDLARLIREEQGSGLPVILATGYSEKAQLAADEGFTIVRKPYDATTLHDALIEVLRKARVRDVA